MTSGDILFNFTGLSGFGAGTYDLLTALGGGLNNATYNIGTIAGSVVGVTLSLATSPTAVQLNAVPSTGTFYWNGSINQAWAGTAGLTTNWTTDLAGTVNANGTPGAASSVIFSTSNQTATTLTTTLGAAFSIRDLTFNNSLGSGPLASITIAPGTGGTLTITPTAATEGINIQAARRRRLRSPRRSCSVRTRPGPWPTPRRRSP
ncbi:MAG: hypothetical protein QM775_11150 [Pirellulales bacterium]